MQTLVALLKAAHFDPDLIGIEHAPVLKSTEADGSLVASVVNAADREIDRAMRSGMVVKGQDFGISDLKRYMIAKADRDLYRLENGTEDAPVDLDPGVTVQTRIAKSDAAKRVAYCVVYSPVEKQGEDVHGDWMTGGEIEKTAWGFLAKGLTSKVDTEHSFIDIDAQVVESFLVRKNDPDFPDDEGAWVVAIKFNDDATWEKVQNGEFTGLSMAGYGNYVTESK